MYRKLIPIEQCPPGHSAFAKLDEQELAVFHLQSPDRFVVTPNSCPHASGNLSAGIVTRRTVSCPVHHWKFDLDSGYCVGTEDILIKRYPCKLEGGWLLVDVHTTLPSTPPKYRF